MKNVALYYDIKGIPINMIFELSGALKTDEEREIFENKYEQIYKSCLRSLIHSPSLRLTKLSGPSIFFFYKKVKYENKQGNLSHKKILLLGERHNVTKPCRPHVDFVKGEYDIHSYLIALGEMLDEKNDRENGSESLDIFVEEDYRLNRKSQKEEVRLFCKSLEDCNNPLESIRIVMKNSEFYPNSIRWHYVDTRSTKYPERLHDDFMIQMYDELQKKPSIHSIIQHILKFYDTNKLVMYLVGLKPEYIDYYLDFCNNLNSRVSPHKHKRNEIQLLIKKHEEEVMVPLIKKRIEKADMSAKEVTKLLESLVSATQSHKAPYNGLLTCRMDAYTLLRMFTVFDKNVTSKNNVPKNIILHAGATHTVIIKEALKLFTYPHMDIMAGDIRVFSNPLSTQCIELKEPFNYFQ